jgi:hypothetical protein
MTDNTLSLNGNVIPVICSGEAGRLLWLDSIYRFFGLQYPKFFKMDNLCKSGFLAAELVCRDAHCEREICKYDTAIVSFNASSSLDDDTIYQRTICDEENYYPSPSVFVYTLANIVIGEIAIRNKIMGESAFYITETFSPQHVHDAVTDIFRDDTVNSLLCGWTEYYHRHCDVLMMYIKRNSQAGKAFSPKCVEELYRECL